MGIDLKYDIGLAAGEGYLGVQGPTRVKKTTMTGNVPGEAKRFEEEAKNIRKEMGAIRPTLVMDETLYQAAIRQGIFFENELSERKAQTKDVAGRKCYVWTVERTGEIIIRQAG